MPLDLILKPRTTPDVTPPTFNQLKTMESVVVTGKVKKRQTEIPEPKKKDNFLWWMIAAVVIVFVILKLKK